MRAMSLRGGTQKHTQCMYWIYTAKLWTNFWLNVQLHLLQLFELGVLELLQCVSVVLLHVTQACVTDLVTHIPDVNQRRTKKLHGIYKC